MVSRAWGNFNERVLQLLNRHVVSWLHHGGTAQHDEREFPRSFLSSTPFPRQVLLSTITWCGTQLKLIVERGAWEGRLAQYHILSHRDAELRWGHFRFSWIWGVCRLCQKTSIETSSQFSRKVPSHRPEWNSSTHAHARIQSKQKTKRAGGSRGPLFRWHKTSGARKVWNSSD